MLELDPEIAPGHRYNLVEDDRRTRQSLAPPLVAGGWIDISEAAVIPLDAALAGTDAQLASYHAAEAATHCYHYVSFACSFGPADHQPFERAWVEIELAADAGAAPIAWSLDPLAAWEKTEVGSTAKIGADFKLLSTETEVTVSTEGKSHHLRAYRERHHNPYWELRATDSTEIDGSHRFHMVTRGTAGVDGRGVLKLSATVLKRRFFILTSEAAATAPPAIDFGLPAVAHL